MNKTFIVGLSGLLLGIAATSIWNLSGPSSRQLETSQLVAGSAEIDAGQTTSQNFQELKGNHSQLIFQESIAKLAAENENLREELELARRQLLAQNSSERRIISPMEDTRAMRESIAGEYFETSMRREMIEQSFEAVFASLIKQSDDPEMTKGLLAITQKYFSWEQLEETFFDLYVGVFSSQELSDIVNFYQSPADRIYAEKQTELAVKSAQATQEIMMRNQEQFTQEIQQLMAKRMKDKEAGATH